MEQKKSCWFCYAKEVSSVVLWLAALASLIIGWLASNNLLGIWGMDYVGWLLTALVLGILALGCKASGECALCGHCAGCGESRLGHGRHGEGCGCSVCKS